MGLSRNLTRVLSFPLARALIPSPEWADSAGGGGGSTFDPADIDYGALSYSRRLWWHKDYANSLSVNTNGTGGMPDVSDPFGAFLNCDPDNASTPLPLALLPQQGAAGIRRVDGAEFPLGAFYYEASANWPNMGTDGITIAFSGYCPFLPSTGAWVFGRDNPNEGTGTGGSNQNIFFQNNTLATGVDLGVEHRVVISAEPSGGNIRALIDGVEVFNTTGTYSSWERTMFYMYSVGFLISGMYALDSQVSDTDMANLDNFLQYGPGP